MSFVEKFDKFAKNWFPAFALKRTLAKQQIENISRNYKGAKTGRDEGFIINSGDANNDLIPYLSTLVARSRDLVRNNSHARSIIDTYLKYVIGPKGIIPQAVSHTQNVEFAEEEEERIMKILNNLDISGKLRWKGFQRLALRSVLVDGECFLRKIVIKKNGRGYIKYQFIESDQLYTTAQYNPKNNNPIEGSIEYDKNTGERKAYYISQHPGSTNFFVSMQENEIRVPAEEMIHIYFQDRPNQMRGEPMLSVCMNDLRNLGEMNEATLIKARIESCIGLIIHRRGHDKSQDIKSIKPGFVGQVDLQDNVSTLAPKTAAVDFGSFNKSHIESSGAGTGLSYETVSHDYSRSNFSSARLSKRDENKSYECMQQFIIDELCVPIIEQAESMSILNDEGPFPRIEWFAPGFGWVDPEKEISADIMSIAANFNTKSEIIAKRTGKSWRDVMRQRGIEEEMEKKEGIANENTLRAASGIIDASRRNQLPC